MSIDHDGSANERDVETYYSNIDEGIESQVVDHTFFQEYGQSLEARDYD